MALPPFPWHELLPVGDAPESPPRVLVVVDTEEEFDWSAPFRREAVGVSALGELVRVQAVCAARGIRPVYVVDYPVARQGGELLRALAPAAEIGAHLHPWVNPPHLEEVTPRHAYPGNLPPAWEREKLAVLTGAIEEAVGRRPRVYKAGRYGLGPRTAETLAALGYVLDLSPAPGFDLSADGGPDYSALPALPFRYPTDPPVLALPTTGGFVGRLPWPGLYRAAQRPWGRRLRLAGVLARLGVVERLRLSPEGHSLDEMLRLTRFLLARGVRRFQVSLHSPSLAPGHTPYARDVAERDALVARLAGYLDAFAGMGGEWEALDVLLPGNGNSRE